MKKNKAQVFLMQIEKLDRMISNKLIEKDQWRLIALGTAAHSDGDRVQSSGSQQRMADAVDRYVDIEREIDAIIDTFVDAKNDVISVIEVLEVNEYDLLHKLYVQRITMQEAADEMQKSYTWATTTHGKALSKVERILEERERRDEENKV
jgi:hypothetical protein